MSYKFDKIKTILFNIILLLIIVSCYKHDLHGTNLFEKENTKNVKLESIFNESDDYFIGFGVAKGDEEEKVVEIAKIKSLGDLSSNISSIIIAMKEVYILYEFDYSEEFSEFFNEFYVNVSSITIKYESIIFEITVTNENGIEANVSAKIRIEEYLNDYYTLFSNDSDDMYNMMINEFMSLHKNTMQFN